jgi:hypothetical protein
MKSAAPIFVLLTLAHPAATQDIPRLEDLRACAAVPREAARLACFDAVMRELASAEPEAPATETAQQPAAPVVGEPPSPAAASPAPAAPPPIARAPSWVLTQ